MSPVSAPLCVCRSIWLTSTRSQMLTLQSHSPSSPLWLWVLWQSAASCISRGLLRLGATRLHDPGTVTVDEGWHGDVCASGRTACSGQGACCYRAKLWGYQSRTNLISTFTTTAPLCTFIYSLFLLPPCLFCIFMLGFLLTPLCFF